MRTHRIHVGSGNGHGGQIGVMRRQVRPHTILPVYGRIADIAPYINIRAGDGDRIGGCQRAAGGQDRFNTVLPIDDLVAKIGFLVARDIDASVPEIAIACAVPLPALGSESGFWMPFFQ